MTCYQPENRRKRNPTWGEATPDGRWRYFDYEELARRDKLNLDILWMKETSLDDSDSLPEPEVLALGIAADLRAAMELFAGSANDLKE